jgi:hypothetical protein
MKKILLVKIFVLIFAASLYGQDAEFQKLKFEFESFEYAKVIKLSNQILKESTLRDTMLVNIYLIRALSFYSIGNEDSCKISFGEILKVNKNFVPDPSIISPKIITLFNEVKTEFIRNENPKAFEDSSKIIKPALVYDGALMRECAIRNIVLPGWGQLHSGNSTKGIILSAISASALASMIYFIADANKKENEYLNSTTQNLIQEKYNAYNKSYKIRNALIISYTAVWLFGQLDLFFLSDESAFLKEEPQLNLSSLPGNYENIRVSFKIPF